MYSKQLLSLEDARIVGEAALAKAMENSDRPMAIAVGDATGELVYFVKMDTARPLFPKMAMNKVHTAIHFGRDTTEVGPYLQADGKGVSDFGDPRFTTIPGGVCLKASDGTVLGAIGTSGRYPKIDEITDLEVALAGAQALSLSKGN
ncbi:heme-binding protein [Chloroflexota bacterium]